MIDEDKLNAAIKSYEEFESESSSTRELYEAAKELLPLLKKNSMLAFLLDGHRVRSAQMDELNQKLLRENDRLNKLVALHDAAMSEPTIEGGTIINNPKLEGVLA